MSKLSINVLLSLYSLSTNGQPNFQANIIRPFTSCLYIFPDHPHFKEYPKCPSIHFVLFVFIGWGPLTSSSSLNIKIALRN